MLNEEDLKKAKELALRLTTQDNRGTRTPIWFLLQDIKEVRAFDSGDHLLYSDLDGEIWRGDNEDDIVKQILDYETDYIEFDDLSEEEKDKKEAELEEEIRERVEGESYEMEYEFVTKQIFLTEEAAKNHLEANKHHYSDKARIYVDHAWRDPEIELVHKILTSFI